MDAPECAEFRGAGEPLLEAQVVDVVDSASPTTRTTPTTPWGSASSRSRSCRRRVLGRGRRNAFAATRPASAAHPLRVAVVRELLVWQVTDLLEETARRLAAATSGRVDDVRSRDGTRSSGSRPKCASMKAGLERFLHERVYRTTACCA